MRYEKVYIDIIVKIDREGNMRPLTILWENAREFAVDRLIRISAAPPEKVGSYLTVRYDCIVNGSPRPLYYETPTGRWFVEKSVHN